MFKARLRLNCQYQPAEASVASLTEVAWLVAPRLLVIQHLVVAPGMLVTVPYEDHLKAKVADIAAIRKSVDAVVLSLHWGLHFVPKVIVDYQPIVAKAAFDAGADVILWATTPMCPRA